MILLSHLFWRHGIDRLRHMRRLARERHAFAQLPPYLLRDLGMERGEYDSYLAEAAGVAKSTRRRLHRFGHDPGGV